MGPVSSGRAGLHAPTLQLMLNLKYSSKLPALMVVGVRVVCSGSGGGMIVSTVMNCALGENTRRPGAAPGSGVGARGRARGSAFSALSALSRAAAGSRAGAFAVALGSRKGGTHTRVTADA